jgi:hypothetical protein
VTREEFEKFVSEEMRSGFAGWWPTSDWGRGRSLTIREVAIAQDAYAEGWIRGVALVLGMAQSERAELPNQPPAKPTFLPP